MVRKGLWKGFEWDLEYVCLELVRLDGELMEREVEGVVIGLMGGKVVGEGFGEELEGLFERGVLVVM